MSLPRLRLPMSVILIAAAGAVASGAVARRWLDAVEVRGGSMVPGLLPGDRLIVESRTYLGRLPRPGEVVLAPDPRDATRELIKRVAGVDPEEGTLEVRGDAPDASTDSRAFGSLPIGVVTWRVAFRYWPPARLGPIAAE